MTRVRFDQTTHRSPLPFDFRASDEGYIGDSKVGIDGDADDSDKIRLRTRTDHLIEVVRAGAAAITADNGSSVTLPPDFPRRTSSGLILAASETEYAKPKGWPWLPPQMIDTVGFTVLLHLEEGGTIDDTGNVVALFNFGEAGARMPTQHSFEIHKGSAGNEIYQAALNHTGGQLITSATAYANNDINVADDVIFLCGVSRSGGNLDAFLDGWVNSVRLTGAPFLAGAAARAVPAAWEDETAAINARDDGTEVGTNTIKRLAWGRGVHQGTTGLAHFGITL